MITKKLIGAFAPGEYHLTSDDFMGVIHVLTVGDLILRGESNVLDKKQSIIVIEITETLFGRTIGVPNYLAIRPDGRSLWMLEQTGKEMSVLVRRG
jgi:hypothetical protein